MDHKLAEQSKAVEKYTLDELSPKDRAEFEVHLFDCPVCSDLIRQNFTITENLKEALEERSLAMDRPLVQSGGWRDWLRWPSLVPTGVAAALAVMLGFQAMGPATPQLGRVLPPFNEPLMTAVRGTMPIINVDRQAEIAIVKVNIDKLPMGPFTGELDQGGKRVVGLEESVKISDDTVDIVFPSKKLKLGQYQLRLQSKADSSAAPVTYSFQVQK